MKHNSDLDRVLARTPYPLGEGVTPDPGDTRNGGRQALPVLFGERSLLQKVARKDRYHIGFMADDLEQVAGWNARVRRRKALLTEGPFKEIAGREAERREHLPRIAAAKIMDQYAPVIELPYRE